jgi:hypothetical protein
MLEFIQISEALYQRMPIWRGRYWYSTASSDTFNFINNVFGIYLVQVSLLLFGQQGLGHFFRYWSLIPISWRIVQILHQRQRKTTNTAPTTPSAIQAASQSTFINTQLYSIFRGSFHYSLKYSYFLW